MDRLTKVQRSNLMSKIRGKNTTPERIIFQELENAGLKFERHSNLLGKPDLVFPREKVAIFIDGDFWHGKDFERRKSTLPAYWVNKITRNIRRDRRYRSALKNEGWKVIRFWDQRVIKRTPGCIKRVLKELKNAQLVNNLV